MDTNEPSNDFIKIYQLHRDRIVHEDALIDRRMTWMLRLQAMLFAFWGGLFALNVAVFSNKSEFHINYSFLKFVEAILCFTGAIAAAGSWVTLRAAFDEIDRIKRLYETAKDTLQYRVPPEEAVLGMVTGRPVLHKWGHIATKYAPFIFIAVWVLLFFMFVARPGVITQDQAWW